MIDPKFVHLLGPVLSLEMINRFLEISLKCALVFLAASLLATLAKRQSAEARARIWGIALFGFLAVAAFSFVPAAVHVSLLPHSPGFRLDPRTAPLDALVKVPGSVPAEAGSIGSDEAVGTLMSATRGGNVLLLLWGAGVVWSVSRWAVAQRKISRRAARAEAPAASVRAALAASLDRLGLKRPVRIVQSPGLPFAWTWGLRRPVIFLPHGAEEWPRPALELVLEHELAHVRRRDFWTEVLARAATALLWFHPAAWAALKNLRRERELACDDAVLDLGAKPSEYAAQLLKMAVSAAPLDRKSYPELALSGRGGLQGRLASILDPRRASKQGRRRIGLVLAPAMIVLAGTTALSSFWMEDGRMGLEARQYWQKTGIPNPGVLDFSIEQAQARGGWTAVYARVLESLAGGGVKFQSDKLVSLGARFWFDGKREEARTILRLALKIKPDAALWFRTVGEQLLEAGKTEMARGYFDMAGFLYPEMNEEIERLITENRIQ